MFLNINQQNTYGPNTVNAQTQTFAGQKKKFSMDNPWVWLLFGIILLLIGSGIAWLTTSHKKNNSMEINQQNTYGPNTVNIGNPARHMNDQMQTVFLANLSNIPLSTRISVMAIMGDPEALNLANEIVSFLNSKGYVVAQPVTGMFGPDQFGVFMGMKKNGTYNINVGHNQTTN